ncbi:hypothetical protein [Actinopolymorpha pittospori]|uniref:hypothetical protein n=1 Tax=Actinopolymorpha pittospori TaxID=648752 RepID=UPI00178B3BD3|nr:hypothetical protein [Actinopolymorpha pittospori]
MLEEVTEYIVAHLRSDPPGVQGGRVSGGREEFVDVAASLRGVYGATRLRLSALAGSEEQAEPHLISAGGSFEGDVQGSQEFGGRNHPGLALPLGDGARDDTELRGEGVDRKPKCKSQGLRSPTIPRLHDVDGGFSLRDEHHAPFPDAPVTTVAIVGGAPCHCADKVAPCFAVL